MFLHTNDAACKHPNFYSYQSFISAAAAYPAFGTSKDATTNKREVAAFLAQISHETTGRDAFCLQFTMAGGDVEKTPLTSTLHILLSGDFGTSCC